jgi:hypothetical protein
MDMHYFDKKIFESPKICFYAAKSCSMHEIFKNKFGIIMEWNFEPFFLSV